MVKKIPARFGAFLALILATGGLTACGGGVKSDANFPDKDRDATYKSGSLVSDAGGFSLLGGDKAKDAGAGMTVNAFLWRAALDTVSFMPLASADPFGGVILTDWYSKPGLGDERMKLNVFVLDRELRADGVRVKVFKQVRRSSRSFSGDWADAEVAPSVATALEEAILTRARQMKIAQKASGK